ncbi:MAG: hypothetical protein K2X66_10270, partial [Cyanobacteria bacterium]|nr:hypothetical protein [Cyanobacteriota bacterium]
MFEIYSNDKSVLMMTACMELLALIGLATVLPKFLFWRKALVNKCQSFYSDASQMRKEVKALSVKLKFSESQLNWKRQLKGYQKRFTLQACSYLLTFFNGYLLKFFKRIPSHFSTSFI